MQQRQPRQRKRMLGRQQQPGKQQQNALPLKYMPPVSRGGLGQCVSAEVCMSLKSATRLERLLFEARRLLLTRSQLFCWTEWHNTAALRA